MASTSNNSNASTRVPSGVRGPVRPPPQHQPPMWWNEPALAHGSPSPYYGREGSAAIRPPPKTTVYRDMERGPALAPELDNDRDAVASRRRRTGGEDKQQQSTPTTKRGGGFMRRMFDSGSSNTPTAATRPTISAPSAPQKVERVLPPGFAASLTSGKASPRGPPPPRPTRPSAELSPASSSPLNRALPPAPPELAALKAAAAAARASATAKPVVVKPENLGRAADALRSHPVRAPELLSVRKAYHRKASVVESSDNGSVVDMYLEPRDTDDLPVEIGDNDDDDHVSVRQSRRRGMIFDLKSLTSFPEPVFDESSSAAAAADDDDNSHKQQSQLEPELELERDPEVSYLEEDGKYLTDDHEQQQQQQSQTLLPAQSKGDAEVPAVVLIPPPEPARTTLDHLSLDYAHKKMLRRDLADANHVIAQWEELGDVLCGLSGGAVEDPRDIVGLFDVIAELAEDSARFHELKPTLDLLARDRRVNVHDSEGLAQGLVHVLNTRNEAVAAATHHKRKSRALEKKLAALTGTGAGTGGFSPY